MGIYKRTKTPEEHAAYMREYRSKNKEKIKAINAKWWSENKDLIKLKTMVKKQETKPFKDMKELTEIDLKNLNKSLKKIIMKKECECTDECLGYLTKECKSIEPKQETLEEDSFITGEKEFKEFKKGILEPNRFDFVCGFTAGAKWQQEQIYNEIKALYENENITGFSKRAYAQCLDIVEQFKNK